MNTLETRLRALQADYPDPPTAAATTAAPARPSLSEGASAGRPTVDVEGGRVRARRWRRPRGLAVVAGAFLALAGAVALVATREAARTERPAGSGLGGPSATAILHWTQTRPGASAPLERWVATGSAPRLRSANATGDRVSDDATGSRQRYDAATDTITVLTPPDAPSTAGPSDDVATLERALRLPTGTVANGTLDGRPVILLDRPGALGYYVDPATHTPLGEYLRDASGVVRPFARYAGFEVLPPTAANLAAFDLRLQHPGAWVVEMPRGITTSTVALPVTFDRGGNDRAVQSSAFLAKARAFAVSHPDLMRHVGAAAIQPDGTSAYPDLVRERSAELNTALDSCVRANGGESTPVDGGGFSFSDPSGSAQKACADQLRASTAYATSEEMHAGAAARAFADAAFAECLRNAGLAPDPGHLASSAGVDAGKTCVAAVNLRGPAGWSAAPIAGDGRLAPPADGVDPRATLTSLATRIGGFRRVALAPTPADLGVRDGLWADVTLATDDDSETGVGLADSRAEVLMGAFRDSLAMGQPGLAGYTVHVTNLDGSTILRKSPTTHRNVDAGTRDAVVGGAVRYRRYATPAEPTARDEITAAFAVYGVRIRSIEMVPSLQIVPLVTVEVQDPSQWEDGRRLAGIFPPGRYEGWIVRVVGPDGTTALVESMNRRLGISSVFRAGDGRSDAAVAAAAAARAALPEWMKASLAQLPGRVRRIAELTNRWIACVSAHGGSAVTASDGMTGIHETKESRASCVAASGAIHAYTATADYQAGLAATRASTRIGWQCVADSGYLVGGYESRSAGLARPANLEDAGFQMALDRCGVPRAGT